MERQAKYDVVVIGGGAAGLSGALVLGRARRSVLVIDAGQPRNAPAEHAHAYLTREGTPPSELLKIGRDEVRSYGVEIMTGNAVTAERLEDGFQVVLEDGSAVEGSRLLVTTGLVDELPPIPGVKELWGRDVLHCPYCHGWEVRDRAIGILATNPLAVHQALMWRQWSEKVTLFQHTAPDFSDEEYEQLAARGIRLVVGEVKGLETAENRLTGVRMEDKVIPCQAVVVSTRLTARSGVLAGLGLEPVEQQMQGHVVGTYIAADPSGATEQPGVWVAGNVTDLVAQVVTAASTGVRAGAMINADLIAEETRLAVAARNAPFSAQLEREAHERVLGDHGL